MTKWEDLTLDLSPAQGIKNVPLYSEQLTGRYLKNWSMCAGADWEVFKGALLEEFKEDDEEQK